MTNAALAAQAVIIEEQPEEGIIVVNGRRFMEDAKGHLVPEANIKPADKLQDQTVRKILQFATDLNGQLVRFRSHTMTDLGTLDALLAEKYEAKIGGPKGNRTYQTIDGLMKVTVQVSDFQTFGPELQAAKALVDECLREWSADSRPELQTVVTRAFDVDNEGQINKANLFRLFTWEISDDRWQRAMQAIRDSMRVTSSKEYVRFYQRKTRLDDWQAVTIDLAKAGA